MQQKIFTSLLTCLCMLTSFCGKANPGSKSIQNEAFLFTENIGQVTDQKGHLRSDILFTAHDRTAHLFITATGIDYQFTKVKGLNPDKPGSNEKAIIQTYKFSLTLAGANPRPQIIREQKNTFTENFYLAHCPGGITGVKTYEKLVYRDVYPGIDWILYSNGQHLKYDFIVRPGGDPAQIKLKVNDAANVSIDRNGELVMKTSLGEVREKKPVSFADNKTVPTHFKQYADGTIGFDVTAPEGATLIIDPSVSWATYYGTSAQDYSVGCTTDGSGNMYMSGTTFSTNGIAAGGMQTTSGGDYDNFLVKFDAAGNRLWATYYGGSGNDQNNGCVTDPSGNVYMAGFTNSATAIASGGFQNIYGGGQDAFLVKFNTAGARVWGTYYGGSGLDGTFVNNCCATDAAGNVYLTGQTNSSANIASGGAQNVLGGGTDAFLVKFDGAGNRLWGTYYGSTGNENSYTCVTDGTNVYITGSTTSASGIASGGFQNTFGGGTDAFFVKFNAAGSRLWATYYGGSGDDFGSACHADASGSLYIAGYTNSTNNITAGGAQNTFAGGTDAFLVKFDATGNRLWGTYYGGPGNERGFGGCVTDPAGNVYLSGWSTSTTGIAAGSGFQMSNAGSADAFITKFDAAGNVLWGTYYGGNDADQPYDCHMDASGTLYVAGYTASASGIATGTGFQTTYAGNSDAFLVKITDVVINTITTGALTGTAFCTGGSLSIPFTATGTFTTGNVFTAQLSDATGSFTTPVAIGTLTGTTSGTINATIPAGTAAGTGYRVRVVSSNPAVTGTNNGSNLTIRVSGSPSVTIAANPGNTICAGTSITFTATAVNGGSYQWKNGTTVVGGNTATYTTTTLANGDVITCTINAANTCISPSSATSAPVTMTVNARPVITVAGVDAHTCAGTPVVLTASGASTYSWAPAATLSAATGSTVTATPATTTTYTVTGTASGCNATATATVYIDTTLTSIVVTPHATSFCSGGSDTITAVVTGNALVMAEDFNGTAPAWAVAYTGSAASAWQSRANGFVTSGTTIVTPDGSRFFEADGTAGGRVSKNTTLTSPAFSLANVTTASLTFYNWYDNSSYDTYAGVEITTNGGTSWNTIYNPPYAAYGGTQMLTLVTVPLNAYIGNPNVRIRFRYTSGYGYAWAIDNVKISGTPLPVWSPATGLFTNAGLTTPYVPGTPNDTVYASPATSVVYTATVGTCIIKDTVQVTVITPNTPTISITANPGDTVCAGTSVTYAATGTNLGAAPVYQWKKNGTNVGTNSPNYTNGTPANGDIITCTVTSNAPCTSTVPVISNNITMVVNPTVVPTINITASPGTVICSGTPVTFTATITNGGTTPVYQWKNGATVVGTNSPTYTDNGLANGNSITCSVTSNARCASTTPATSTGITMTVNQTVTPTVAIAVSPSSTICPGATVTFTANINNGGSTPSYQWKRGTTVVGTNSPSYTTNGLSNGDIITCTLASNAVCATAPSVVSNGITMVIGQMVNPTITISANTGNRICAGTPVTFSCTTTNAGATPVYQWRRNGITVGTGSTYTNTGLLHGDSIICLLGSSIACVSNPLSNSNSIIMSVNYPVRPTVTILANPGTNPAPGATVSFVANVTGSNGATDYQWTKNGAIIPGAAGSIYTTNSLNNGDTISCIVNRNSSCAGTEAQSNKLVIKINSTGTGNMPAGGALALFPNPNSGTFRLKGNINATKPVNLDVVNTIGQTIYHQSVLPDHTAVDEQIMLPETAAGTYLLRITSEGISTTLRFVITK